MATPRQTWTIFTQTGVDVRNLPLDIEQASNYISRLFAGDVATKNAIADELISLGGIRKTKAKADTKQFEELYTRAYQAGREAAQACTPRPMHVVEHANPLDDSSPIIKASNGRRLWLRLGQCSSGKLFVCQLAQENQQRPHR